MTEASRRRERLLAVRRRERSLAVPASRQHGVVARRQLVELGLGTGAVDHRVRLGRLHVVHRGVYAVGHDRVSQRGRWLAAVLAHGEGAVLSHHSAAAHWGLAGESSKIVDVTSFRGRPGRRGVHLHRAGVHPSEATNRTGIPVTSVARTLLDLAEAVDRQRLERAFEEADRLGLLELRALEHVCERGRGRKGVAAVRKLISAAREPAIARSPLEEHFAEFCRARGLPPPVLNASVLGFEVDALWPSRRLIVELDGFAFHRHRAAFERDRVRDAALQAAGYRVIRLTHRRLDEDGPAVAAQLRALLGVQPDARTHRARSGKEPR